MKIERPLIDFSRVVRVYADGGICRKNPSPFGGSWAFVYASWNDIALCERSGCVTPQDVGLETVSNNLTEFLALLFALEFLPKGWSGLVHSDSGCTVQRFRDNARCKGIPDDLVARKNATLARLGTLTYVLLGGHPTRRELELGVRGDGKPVSPHNVRCDHLCGIEAAGLLVARAG